MLVLDTTNWNIVIFANILFNFSNIDTAKTKIFIKGLIIKVNNESGYIATLTRGIKIIFIKIDNIFTEEKLYIEIGKDTKKQINDM